MPNLGFYAVGEDQRAVLDVVFGLGGFRVFEAYSEPGSELREFAAPGDIPVEQIGLFLVLFADGSGPGPTVHRQELGSGSFRYRCGGWGQISLHFGDFHPERGLTWSNTNHNSARRAEKWAEVSPDLQDPSEWDFAAVMRASGRFNRAVRKLAVDKIGPHPVLSEAAEIIRRQGLKYEYGMGVHARPSSGMRRPNSGDR